MRILADLHMHSYFSDGVYSPDSVCEKAAAAGCKIVSLTDHDTLSGIQEMNDAAAKRGIINLTGIEISTFLNVEAHILGYNVNLNHQGFCAFVAELEQSRRERSKKILQRLKAHNIVIDEEYFNGWVKRELSRSHIAVAMAKLGFEPDPETAFKKWLKEGRPAYVPMLGRHPKDAIDQIRAAGGKAVLAHPMRIALDEFKRKELIKQFTGWGLEGLEAVYKRSSSETMRHFRSIADALNLFITCGADYHSDRNEIIARFLPERTVKELHAAPLTQISKNKT